MTGTLTSLQTKGQRYQVISNTQLMGMIYNSGIAATLDLSNPATIVLNSLAYHFNTIRKDMFPTQELIASKTNLSISSIKRGISELLSKGLLIKTKKSKSSTNLYKFTGKFFDLINLTSHSDQIDPNHEVNLSRPCHEHKKDNIRNNRSSCQSNNKQNLQHSNDDAFKNTNKDSIEYKQVLAQLEKWSFTGGEFSIKQYGIDKIKTLIDIVKTNNPVNKGAYLRTLIHTSDTIGKIKNNPLNGYYKPSSFTPQSKNNNKTCEALEHIKSIQQINDAKPTKEEIIQKMIAEGKQTEILQLKKLWKII